MEVKIVTKPAFTVLGFLERNKDGPKFIPPLWEKLMKRHDEVKNIGKSDTGYGVMDNYLKTTEEFDYLAGYEVEPGTEAPEGMTTWNIPKQTYAVIACTVPTIMETYEFWEDWLSRSDYQHGDGPEFEHYPEDFADIKKSRMHMYFPVRKT